MRVYGYATVGNMQQRALSAPALLDISPDRIVTLHRSAPVVGDLLWVKEDFHLVTSNKAWLAGAHFVFPGHCTDITHIPAEYRSTNYIRRPCSASKLERADSRATLEILSFLPDEKIHCRVIMQNVDAFVNAEAPPV